MPARRLLVIALLLAAFVPDASRAAAPLLMEGKKTLYQRVLTRPGAQLAGTAGEAKGKPVPALSQLYVYQRKKLADREWLQVGASSTGKTDGWIDAGQTIPWHSQLALAFTNPAGRERSLLFASRDTVTGLLGAPDRADQVKKLRKAVLSGTKDPRVISIEPEEHIDINEQFYLLPILEAEEVDLARERVRVVEVASVTAREEARAPVEKAAPEARPGDTKAEPLRSFSAALVFVIDSTISMGPYIERTREAVRKIHAQIDEAGLSRKVRFGLVAFRSSVEATPGLEYVTKVYADPNQVKTGQEFLKRVASLEPAKKSSARFDEDAYAGLLAAVREIDWKRFGGRYVVLITDAGALDGEDDLSSTKLGAEQVRLELEAQGIALHALHLKTPAGRSNHASAERQYREVTRNPVIGAPLYYPVETGSVEAFGQMVDTLGAGLVDQVRGAEEGEAVPGSIRPKARAAKSATPEQLETQLSEDMRLLGRAMQLAYLGRVEGVAAPPLFRAWISDRDFEQPARATTEVRVLLTKSQLSDLAQSVSAILDAGEKAQRMETADFFDLIRSAAASLARGRTIDSKASKLGELGLLGEYLEGLPYQSDVMRITRDMWTSWSRSEQEDMLDRLRRNVRLYRIYNEDVDRWIPLAPDAEPGDFVYPVPLEALP
jgi:hypothetical protein